MKIQHLLPSLKKTKMKTYKLQRDNKHLIVQQIVWINEMRKVELTKKDTIALLSLTKPKLIERWCKDIKLVKTLPDEKWLQIYK